MQWHLVAGESLDNHGNSHLEVNSEFPHVLRNVSSVLLVLPWAVN